ncbi:MAG: hypothetical protein IPK59_23010 [Rhodospirillaceae bacterium]|nr:hypothetical protein [Rhodospirillaceae bacterium]
MKKLPHVAELVYRNGGAPSPAFRRLDRCGQDLVLPYAARDSFSEISFADALDGNIPAQLIKGRDIVIDATRRGHGRIIPAPSATAASFPEPRSWRT